MSQPDKEIESVRNIRCQAVADILTRRQPANLVWAVTPVDDQTYMVKIITAEPRPWTRRQCSLAFTINSKNSVRWMKAWTTSKDGKDQHEQIITDSRWQGKLVLAGLAAIMRGMLFSLERAMFEQFLELSSTLGGQLGSLILAELPAIAVDDITDTTPPSTH